jgi:hypothetical protein
LKGEFEVHAYKLLGAMVSDHSKAPHEKAAALMRVYAYYTAHLDDPANKLDNPNPPTSTPGFTGPPHEDPGLRKFYAINYMEYVQQEIINKAKGKGSLDSIPDGSASGFWGIEPFEKWALHGTHIPSDPLDSLKAYEHDVKDHDKTPPKHTELDKAIMNEFDNTVTHLMNDFGYDVLNYRAIQDYLRRKVGPGVSDSEAGIFTIYRRAAGDIRCTLWDMSSSIGTLSRRREQVKAIQALVQRRLVQHIIENKKTFFLKEVDYKTKILKRFPGLADLKWVPDALNPLAP